MNRPDTANKPVLRVLLIENQELIRERLARAFAQSGEHFRWEVQEAENRKEALSAIRTRLEQRKGLFHAYVIDLALDDDGPHAAVDPGLEFNRFLDLLGQLDEHAGEPSASQSVKVIFSGRLHPADPDDAEEVDRPIDIAVQAMRSGAWDVIAKRRGRNFARVVRSIEDRFLQRERQAERNRVATEDWLPNHLASWVRRFGPGTYLALADGEVKAHAPDVVTLFEALHQTRLAPEDVFLFRLPSGGW